MAFIGGLHPEMLIQNLTYINHTFLKTVRRHCLNLKINARILQSL
ncbi:hypothetical protein GXM_02544 [Nostoc sphaeroides CCNUC1]|uniref:Uncharacterized protein n=1 Tax=Nostoc sphaeroides CCNUC1 TaxID=2653204 RepID=A0A5P8VZ29_9NOSO|nr:hypothetical protein GXM_02544 [Nostoc sphaeroides CCNUC1]